MKSYMDIKNKKWIILIVIFIMLIWVLHSCNKKSTIVIPPPVVKVQHPISKPMIDYVTQTGTTVAYNSVNLVARVEGYLEKIQFTDGSMVRKGQELFVIQPLPYAEQLKAAKATLAAQKAQDTYNQSEYKRQQRMLKDKATSQNEVEKWLAKTQEVQAEIDKATANVINATITYSYTHVLAPFDGRIGRHLVDIGNLVGNGQATKLATIEQIEPLYIYFNLNELDFLKLRDAARAKGIKPQDLHEVPVYISVQNKNEFKTKAVMDFVNTGLNASTGTMELRAILANKDHAFIPGAFVQVRVAVSKPTPVLTVPNTSILYDQIGPYVLSVNPEKKVLLKRVSIGSTNQGVTAITKGLVANDWVIVDGIQNATVGNKVTVQETTYSKEK